MVVSGVLDVVIIFGCILYVLGDWGEGILAALLDGDGLGGLSFLCFLGVGLLWALGARNRSKIKRGMSQWRPIVVFNVAYW